MLPMEVKLKPGSKLVNTHLTAENFQMAHRVSDCCSSVLYESKDQLIFEDPKPQRVIRANLRGSYRYFSLDFFKGFWQFAMAKWS
ncbi:hypothetical protein PHMEG_0004556 [Phytophthora megakarya]|uniref:Uncharacterized protein n=1 Tax=Phytophthora megakarya TaxID=4795 RepID=A0A225WTJ2_9STRA|nr:hypothetical protein PHMEG_0004556 [Phytophthora megakarya]